MTKGKQGWGKTYTNISELLLPQWEDIWRIQETYGKAAEKDIGDALWLPCYKKMNKRWMNKTPKVENCTSNKTRTAAVSGKRKMMCKAWWWWYLWGWNVPNPKSNEARDYGLEVEPKHCTKGIQWKQKQRQLSLGSKESLICRLRKSSGSMLIWLKTSKMVIQSEQTLQL